MGAVVVFLLAAAAILLLSSSTGPGIAGKYLSGNRSGQRDGPASFGTTAQLSGSEQAGANHGSGIVNVPLMLDFLGTALETGLPMQNALHVVAGATEGTVREALLRVAAALEIGVSWQDAWEGNTESSELAQIHSALIFGALTGASAASLLYAEAAQIRRSRGRQAEKRAAALGVKLVLPLGLCSLPAFVALGIVPVVIAMVPTF
ncbi:type II secretion system F family protein [Arthrobacter psychrochitiniphilus]|uniref:type II secretion system F family protein n=1 Tax=Arthrobacter psychrochitiniphilus TaxID=291045 RepID=UPI003F7BD6AF